MPMESDEFLQFIVALKPNTSFVFPTKAQLFQCTDPLRCHIMLPRIVLVQLVLIALAFGPSSIHLQRRRKSEYNSHPTISFIHSFVPYLANSGFSV